MTILKKLILAIVILLGILFLISYHVVTAETPDMTPEQRYETELDHWITKLSFCESSNNPDKINWHDNGSPSYGYVQYKLSTFLNYNKKFNTFPEMTLDNLHSYVMQKEKQIALTKDIIKNDYQWQNWYNCTKKIGLPPQI